VHALDKDATPDDIMRSDIILHGHTHRAELRLEDGMLYINPGHLKGPIDKNARPSFAFLDIQDKNVVVKIIGLDFKVIQEMELFRSENRLYKI
jgi:predicted phosphodiesterase